MMDICQKKWNAAVLVMSASISFPGRKNLVIHERKYYIVNRA